MVLEPVATFFQDARHRSGDDALWNGKREISRLRYLASCAGNQTLRHWNFIESS